MTGEHGLILVFHELKHECTLRGRPRLTLHDAKGVDVALGVTKTNEYLDAIPVHTVHLEAGQSAYVLVAKYRCDLGDAQVARIARVHLPLSAETLRISIRNVDIARCDGSTHGPGQTIAVSPFVRTIQEFQIQQPG